MQQRLEMMESTSGSEHSTNLALATRLGTVGCVCPPLPRVRVRGRGRIR